MERAEYLVMAAVEGDHWWYGGMRAITASMLDSAYAGRRDLHVLDAGCGSGGNLRFLRRYGAVAGPAEHAKRAGARIGAGAAVHGCQLRSGDIVRSAVSPGCARRTGGAA